MKSIIDKSVQELVSMDIKEVRSVFLEEIKLLEDLDDDLKNERLKYIFNRLFSFESQKGSEESSFVLGHGLYVDLISTPELVKINYFRDYLAKYKDEGNNLFYSNLLLDIFNFYDSHTMDEILKFNYIFRTIIIDDNELKNFDINYYFNSRILSMFDKESLAQLYRDCLSCYSSRQYILNILLKEENHKALYLVSLMMNKIKFNTGHSADFLNRCFFYISYSSNSNDKFLSFLKEVYNCFVKDEEDFKHDFLSDNSFWEIEELSNIILDKYPYSFDNFKDFRSYLYRIKDMLHYCVFKNGTLDLIYMGKFDVNRDFKDIEDDNDLKAFKEAIFQSLYGISLDKAMGFVKKYGLCLDALEKDLSNGDKEIFSILNAIKEIVNLNVDDKNKINVLQLMYYDNFLKNGEYFRCNYSMFYLESLFNRMIINTYNNRLLDINNLDVIGQDNGIIIYDAGIKFDCILTAFDGVGHFYDENVNIKNRWNGISRINNHGLSSSYINNENIGVINIDSVLVGFNYIPHYSLNKMGASDIYSETGDLDLRDIEASECGDIWKFYPVSILQNENRYGYNELLLDRYLLEDKDNVLKLQPSYVIFFKVNDEFKDSALYKNSLKTAVDFSIPLVIIDVEKVKEHEKKEISLMEEELFLSDECCEKLMHDIVVRYMNNYTGSLMFNSSLSNSCYEDFSIKGMEEFFDKLITKIEKISDKLEKEKWINSLEYVYLDEKRKFNDAKRVLNYRHSVSNFILKKYNLLDRIKCLREEKEYDYLSNRRKLSIIKFLENGEIEDVSSLNPGNEFDISKSIIKVKEVDSMDQLFVPSSDFDCNKKAIIDFINSLKIKEDGFSNYGSNFLVWNSKKIGDINGAIFEVYGVLDDEKRLIENLLVSYFFENNNMIVDDMICHDFDCDVEFSCSDDFDFANNVKNSSLYQRIFDNNSLFYISLNEEKLNTAMGIVEEIANDDFLKIFASAIDKYCNEKNERFEDVACRLLDKKANIRKEFDRILVSNKNKKDTVQKR